MPDILGYDRRTIASKFANQALAAIGGAALNSIQNYGYSHFNRSSMPPLRGKFRPWVGRRRRYKKFGRRRSKRYARKNTFTGAGPQTRRRVARISRRKLNTNMTRNDYDSSRDRVLSGYVTGSVLTPAWRQFDFRVPDLQYAVTKILDYDHYKVANIQCVITAKWQDNQEIMRMLDDGDPYLYVIPRIHPDSITSTPNLQLLKTTPGVMRFSLRRTKPIVINLLALVPRKQEYVADQSGGVYNVEQPFFKPGWIHNPDTGSVNPGSHPKFGHIAMYIPRLESTTVAIPNFTVEYYCTTYFRGNRNFIDV